MKSKIIRRKNNIFLKTFVMHQQEIIAVILLSILIFFGLSIISFNVNDNSWLFFSNKGKISNWCGIFGANVAVSSLFLFGTAIYTVLAYLFFITYILLRKLSFRSELDRLLSSLVLIVSVTTLMSISGLDFTNSYPGGLIGNFLSGYLISTIGKIGSVILLYGLLWVSAVILLRMSVATSFVMLYKALQITMKRFLISLMFVIRALYKTVRRIVILLINKVYKNNDVFIPAPVIIEKFVEKEEFSLSLDDVVNNTQRYAHKSLFFKGYGLKIKRIRNSVFRKNIFNLADEVLELYKKSEEVSYTLPDLSLFKVNRKKAEERELLDKECKDRALKLEEKLKHFGVEGKVSAILPGPVVTMFEYTPEIGTKISKIMALEDDLALVLRALSIRIIAPIPGRSVVGFEISNEVRESVFLSDILLSKQFQNTDNVLPLVLGVDIVGRPVIEDLLKMPHLLVAGSTGSGKSVGLNAILVSLLCRMFPEDMRLILIDPKRLEFASYKDIPHLLFPIITDSRKVAVVLKWVIKEMESRYERMAAVGVRNLLDYRILHKDLPFIVIIIDELADLMMVSGREIEVSITRIAQMARAAGIHMILATQRPSVDILTGIIKVNFPSRVSFKVSSKVDSKTILDSMGAEKLLGKGDMLCTTANSSELKRVHGAYVSDGEINKLTEQLRLQQETSYLDLDEMVLEQSQARAEDNDDHLVNEVIDFVKTLDEVSISMLQRKYRIGFNRSARLIESLEMRGVVAPSQGGKPRKVIR